jgi:AcrR family transcriptional regulator
VAGTKERLLDSSAELLRRQGYAGTGIKQILAGAQVPFGSLYHFFPGGKEQLGAETIRTSGRLYIELFAAIAAQAPDVPSAVEGFFDGAAETLLETDYADACPIATVALEVSSTNAQLRQACAEVFDAWIDGATSYFCAGGIEVGAARELALNMLCLLEGAFVFCRALRSTEPLQVAGASAVAATRAALAGDA